MERQAKINKMRPFGIELELISLLSKNTLAQILCENGCSTYIDGGHTHYKVPQGYDFLIKPDGSLSGSNPSFTWHTAEIISKPLVYQERHTKKLRKLLRVLNKLGCEVNNTTGLHVHHSLETDIKTEHLKSLYNLVYRYEPIIYNFVSKSRRRNSFCPMLPSKTRLRDIKDTQTLLRNMGRNRYGCNFGSLLRDPRNRFTLEFRYHNGTIDIDKILTWVLFTQRLIEHSQNRYCGSKNRVPNNKTSLYNLLYTIGLKNNSKIYKKVDPELLEAGNFLVNRWKYFCEAEKKSGEIRERRDREIATELARQREQQERERDGNVEQTEIRLPDPPVSPTPFDFNIPPTIRFTRPDESEE